MTSTLNVKDSGRYSALRERAERGEALSDAEIADLADLEQRWDAADAVRLTKATERIEDDTNALRHQNQRLRELFHRKQELAIRLEYLLNELQTEQALINAEIARLLTPAEAAERSMALTS